ncbi:MAG: response regulator transcription factor [Flammeovirgaceae bacterium]|jgi:two-component system, OmpR family, response regulator VicR|nr:response regulator transcription factor [Flammeovirgaceae bacterium]|tara:strand:- start:1286 stop:1978 length:693 start_codon:yes stop_codon:yes gene_type:complete
MSKAKLLIVEDDPNLGQILQEYLTMKGFSATLRSDGESGLHAFYDAQFDLCLLDLMMPKKDGFSLAKDIRKVNVEIPIIFVTAKSMQEDVLKGFNLGGDDYVTKPFSMEELLVRINAVLRRSTAKKKEDLPDEYIRAGLRYNYQEHALTIHDETVSLTTKENELMKLFFENLNQTVDRTVALKRIWKDDSYFNARSMDVYIAKLRKHLKRYQQLKIVTIHGEGFKLIEAK